MDTILPSEPSNYSQIMSRSFVLYRKSFSKIILLSVLVSVTAFFPRIMYIILGQNMFSNFAPFSPYRLFMLLINLIALLFFIGIIWHMHCVIRKVREPFIEDVSVGIKKMIYALIATIIQNLLVVTSAMMLFGFQVLLHQNHLLFANTFLGIVLTGIVFIGQACIVIYIATLFIFLIPLIAVENKGIIGSLQRSALLVWNHWWRVFSVQITPWIVYAILFFIIRNIFDINTQLHMTKSFFGMGYWSTLIHIVLFALFIPWFAALLLIQLNDLELRHQLAKK